LVENHKLSREILAVHANDGAEANRKISIAGGINKHFYRLRNTHYMVDKSSKFINKKVGVVL